MGCIFSIVIVGWNSACLVYTQLCSISIVKHMYFANYFKSIICSYKSKKDWIWPFVIKRGFLFLTSNWSKGDPNAKWIE